MELGPAPRAYDGSDGTTLSLTPRNGTTIAISPYPLDLPSVDVGFVYKAVTATPFANSEDFREAYFKAPLKFAAFTLVAG